MLMTLWPGVQAGDGGAVDRALRIMDRQAQLHGLDAPKKIEHTGSQEHVLTIGGTREEFIRSLQEHRQAALPHDHKDFVSGKNEWPDGKPGVGSEEEPLVIDVEVSKTDSELPEE